MRLVVVDYLQLVANKAETREQSLNETTLILRQIAGRERLSMLTASQLNKHNAFHSCEAIGFHPHCVLHITPGFITIAKQRFGRRLIDVPCLRDGAVWRFVKARRVYDATTQQAA